MGKWKSNKESCNSSHYCALFSPPPLWAPRGGSCCDEQLSRLLFNRQATSLETAVVDSSLPPNAEPKLLAQVATPHLLHSFNFHEVSPVLQLPAHAIPDKHGDTWAAQDPAVLYERQYRNNWSTLQRSGGGRRNYGMWEGRGTDELHWMAFSSCSPQS